jgi:hypothetical protein
MTDHADATLRDRFARQRDDLLPHDFADVRARASAVTRAPQRHVKRGRRPRRLILVAITASVFVIGGATALAYQYLGPSPALTAGVSAFNALPPARTLPDAVTRNLDRRAAYAGVSVAEATERMRLLRSGLGQGDLYAFRGANDSVCFVLTGHVGSCIRDFTMGEPGVMWAVSGGYPGEGSAVVGLVADNVTALTLVLSGQRTNLDIVNNSFYADLGPLSGDPSIALEVRYGDGSTNVIGIGGNAHG